ncbi:MAG: ketopantoate reductase family protein [Thermoplasmatota archaeon]
MKVGIVGPGALGTFLAGMIGKMNQVVLYGRKDLSLKEVDISGKTQLKTDIKYTTDPNALSDLEYVIICTKSFQTEQVMKDIHKYLSEKTMVVSLQNGLKNEKIISKFVGEDRVIGGITENGITFKKYGEVIYAGKGETIIGLFGDNFIIGVKKFSQILNDAGIENKISDNIYGHIWKKVIINAGINPITALSGLKNGAIIDDKNLFSLMEYICEESVKVAETEVVLPGKDPFKEAVKVAKNTSENKSSMLQDVENKRKTEIDCINGAIVSVGSKHGVDTPYNRTMVNLIKCLENSYLDNFD